MSPRDPPDTAPAPPFVPLPVPEALLVPLLEVAGDALRRLAPEELPVALRPLGSFDRRGLASGPARHQLRRAIDLDDEFRAAAFSAFLERPEVRTALEGWGPEHAATFAVDAAARADLPLVASMLYAARPAGFEFGLGIVCAVAENQRDEQTRDDDARARDTQLAVLDQARQRSETALETARRELARLERELREERRARRDREARAEDEAERARRKGREAEAAAAKARTGMEMAEARATREAERAREAERRLRELRRDVGTRTATSPSPPSALERDRLEEVARRARDLAGALEGILRARPDGARSAPSHGSQPVPTAGAAAVAAADAAPTPSSRRAVAACPPGVRADTAAGLDGMLRTRGVVLVVDGYNVSMRGWPGVAVGEQREALFGALTRLCLRLRCDVVVVFDGADVEGVRPPRRPGLRVVFSDAGEAADPVVVREVAALGREVPVIVASSDGWVRDHSTAEGATVVPADALVELLRR